MLHTSRMIWITTLHIRLGTNVPIAYARVALDYHVTSRSCHVLSYVHVKYMLRTCSC